MSTLKQATQSRDTSNMKLLTNPAVATSRPALPTSADPEFSSLAIAPIPPVLGTDTDAARSFYRQGVSQIRTMPLPAASLIAVGAQAASQAKVITENIVTGEVGSLVMPNIFTVGGDNPFTSQGQPIEVTLNPEPSSTFLAGPVVTNTPLSLDTATSVTGTSSNASVGPLSPTTSDDFAMFFICALSSASAYINGTIATGWTTVFTTSPARIGVYSQSGVSSPLSVTDTDSFGNWSSVFALFHTNETPVLIQSTSTGGVGTSGSVSFTSNLTAGNTAIIAFGGNFTAISSISDSEGNTYRLVGTSSIPGGGGTISCTVYAADNVIGGTAATISFTISSPNNWDAWIGELSGFELLSGAPEFRLIKNTDLDNAVFGAAGSSANAGAVPNPGGVAHTPPDYLGDDAAWHAVTPMTTLGDTIYENSTPVPARLAGNTSATKNFLTQTGTGSASAAPVWGTIASGDLPSPVVLPDSGGIHSDRVALTTQTASISATNLVASPTATTLYQISYYLNETTAGTSGTVTVTFTWNDGASQSTTSATVTFGNLGQYASGVFVVKATTGAVQYSTTVTSPVGSPAYSLDIRVLPLG